MELWKDIEGYEGFYQVSSLGRVRSLDRAVRHSGDKTRIQKGKELRLPLDFYGYEQVGLYYGGRYRKHKVHRLVANAFIDNPLNKPEINHIDENKQNNKSENLSWCTRKENENHGTKRARGVKNTNYNSIASQNRKSVLQYNSSGELVREWSSIAEIRDTLGYSSGNISSCCHGRIKRVYNSIWIFKAAV